MVGRILISLISMIFCFLAGLVGPFSAVHICICHSPSACHTGGVLSGDISTTRALFLRPGPSPRQADLAIFVAVVADQENGFGRDFFVDAGAAFGGGSVILLWPSGYYDSLLLLAVRHHASLVHPGQANEVRFWTQTGAFHCAGDDVPGGVRLQGRIRG